LANLGGFVVVVPIVIAAIGIPEDAPPWVLATIAGVLAVTAAITRILAIPQVEQFLQRSIRWLAAGDTATENVAAVVVPSTGDLVAGPASPITDGQPVEVLEQGAVKEAVAVAVEAAKPAAAEDVPVLADGDPFPDLYDEKPLVVAEDLAGDEKEDEETDESK